MNREDVRTGQTVRINNHRGHTRDICGATGTVVNYDHNPASYSLKVDLGEFGVRWFHHSDLTWVADPIDPMSLFEIGYDRHYIGAALHCKLCPGNGWDGDNDVLDEIADLSIADLIAAATNHLDTHHKDHQ